jgi:hypothetical protein
MTTLEPAREIPPQFGQPALRRGIDEFLRHQV